MTTEILELVPLGKDINDLVVNGLKPLDVELILENNTYSGLEAKLALTIWKRV